MILERNAPAKVNLGLHVLRKRENGYHDIETVFLPIPWHDRLKVAPAGKITFTCSDDQLPSDESNLCVRAARLLSDYVHEDRGASIHLEKQIPFGAGLGGGSSDAASTLLMLNELWRLNLDAGELHALAIQLGADVPFFLSPSVMFATGLGEELAPLTGAGANSLYQFPFELLVVVPAIHVSTAEAYRNISPNALGRHDIRDVVRSNDFFRWRSSLVNDFERSVFAAFPEIKKVKDMMYTLGAGYASMSGSGASVFGVFEDRTGLIEAAGHFSEMNVDVWFEINEEK